MTEPALHLFEAVGIELEYMIVDSNDLSVKPIADRVLEAVAGEIVSEVELGALSWSNELVLHVIELKTNGPAKGIDGLCTIFDRHVRRINTILEPMQGRLMPTACHPWMDPMTETVLWPHEYSPVYEAYDRIFGCRGHGWSNLQSVHINLPFSGDEEFAKLHAAIRFLLPIMPALTAASPILNGKPTGFLDSRMEVYRHNALRIPSVAGLIVPEPVYTRADYDRDIFQRMYADIAPFDPDGTLQHPFLNSRGAIARFDRDAIEIRVLDIQECPQADLATAGLIVAAIKSVCEEQWAALTDIKDMETGLLGDLLVRVIRDADDALIDNRNYLNALGLSDCPVRVGDVWQHLATTCGFALITDTGCRNALETILTKGCLARRILQALDGNLRSDHLRAVYSELCNSLARGTLFHG